eukprot:TRINITY_DN20558_c0_g1_i1.p1 TRINITY_DN20558_c0_g1~~TRINITY_DN20558_c0_g1_i1.p1  ORF type:complete len:990 (+),score=345.86 TRINITY_DN20558_c0_g1_i1:62-3031(+)
MRVTRSAGGASASPPPSGAGSVRPLTRAAASSPAAHDVIHSPRTVLLQGKQCRQWRKEQEALAEVRKLTGSPPEPRAVVLADEVLLLQEPALPETPTSIREKLDLIQDLEDERKRKAAESLELQIATLQKRFNNNNYEQMYLLFRGKLPQDQDPDAMVPVHLLQQEQKKSATLKEQKKQLTTDLDSLQSAHQILKQERDQLAASSRVLEDHNAHLLQEIALLKEECATLGRDVVALELREEEVQKVAEQVPLLQGDLGELRREYAEQQQENAELTAKVAQGAEQVAALQGQLQELEKARDLAQGHVQELRDKVVGLEMSAQQLQSAAADAERQAERKVKRAAADAALRSEQRTRGGGAGAGPGRSRTQTTGADELDSAQDSDFPPAASVASLPPSAGAAAAPTPGVPGGVPRRAVLAAAAASAQPLERMLMEAEDRCVVSAAEAAEQRAQRAEEEAKEAQRKVNIIEQIKLDLQMEQAARKIREDRVEMLQMTVKNAARTAQQHGMRMATDIINGALRQQAWHRLFLWRRMRMEQRGGTGTFSARAAAEIRARDNSKEAQADMPSAAIAALHIRLWNMAVLFSTGLGGEPPPEQGEPPQDDAGTYGQLAHFATAAELLIASMARQLKSGLGRSTAQVEKAMKMIGTMRKQLDQDGSDAAQEELINFLQAQRGKLKFAGRSQIDTLTKDFRLKKLRQEAKKVGGATFLLERGDGASSAMDAGGVDADEARAAILDSAGLGPSRAGVQLPLGPAGGGAGRGQPRGGFGVRRDGTFRRSPAPPRRQQQPAAVARRGSGAVGQRGSRPGSRADGDSGTASCAPTPPPGALEADGSPRTRRSQGPFFDDAHSVGSVRTEDRPSSPSYSRAGSRRGTAAEGIQLRNRAVALPGDEDFFRRSPSTERGRRQSEALRRVSSVLTEGVRGRQQSRPAEDVATAAAAAFSGGGQLPSVAAPVPPEGAPRGGGRRSMPRRQSGRSSLAPSASGPLQLPEL